MIVGKKWFYILLSSLFVILVIINLALWTTTPGIGTDMADGALGYTHGGQPTKYVGFKTLFEIFSTFPGPAMTIESLNTWCNVFTNFNLTGLAVIDYFIAIFRFLTGPVVAGVSIIGDLVTNLIWFFRLIFIDTWWSMFETHKSMYDMPTI